MKTAVIACLHGNEKYGLEVLKRLPPYFYGFIGNKIAIAMNKRFIVKDMNRIFPGKKDGIYEERQAYELNKKLKDFNQVIDLHSSSGDCPMFGIITKPNKEKINLAKKLGLKRLVIMPQKFSKGGALIDNIKCGISIEVGPHVKKQNISEAITIIKNLKENNPNQDIEIFLAYKTIKRQAKNILIKNFQEIKKHQTIAKDKKIIQKADSDFTAILVNEQAYQNTLCIACKKITF